MSAPAETNRRTDVVVLIGAGVIGQAIVRRIAAGKTVIVGDLRKEAVDAAVRNLEDTGYRCIAAQVDVSSPDSVSALVRLAETAGRIVSVVHAAGVSPSQAPIETILKVDLYGTALVLELFGQVIAEGGAGLVISSQSGYRLAALSDEQNRALATTPTDDLLALSFVQPAAITDTLHAYQLSKRGNILRVMAEAVRWGRRGARINSISPGIIITPLANDELNGPRGEVYRRMISSSVAERAGTADEIATLAHFLLGPDGSFVTGSDFLIDGGTTAMHWYGG